MNKLAFVTLGAAWLILRPLDALPHHSAAPFDFASPTVVEGPVKEVKIVNPHAAIVLELSDEERGTRDVEFEGMSASIFYRSGYYNGAVKVGEVLKVTIAPRHDGKDGGFISSFVTEGGEQFGFGVP
jgi:hypothetical protein